MPGKPSMARPGGWVRMGATTLETMLGEEKYKTRSKQFRIKGDRTVAGRDRTEIKAGQGKTRQDKTRQDIQEEKLLGRQTFHAAATYFGEIYSLLKFVSVAKAAHRWKVLLTAMYGPISKEWRQQTTPVIEYVDSHSSTAQSSIASSPLHSQGSVQNLDLVNRIFETQHDPPTERERNSLTYYDLIQDLPCMQGSTTKLPGEIREQLGDLERMYERSSAPGQYVSSKELVVYGMLKHHVHSDWVGASGEVHPAGHRHGRQRPDGAQCLRQPDAGRGVLPQTARQPRRARLLQEDL
eukprot:767646-Hanusia_phi.AAC.9